MNKTNETKAHSPGEGSEQKAGIVLAAGQVKPTMTFFFL